MDLWKLLAETDFAQSFRDWEDGFPTMESVHLVGLAVFFGSIVLLDLSVIAKASLLPLRAMKTLCLPLTWIGFALLTFSGTVLFVAAADQYARTWSFWIKMALIACGGLNAFYFHVLDRPANQAEGRAAGERLSAVLSIAIWLGAIIAGRWVGYERHP